MKKIGFIGVGVMGKPMVRNLIKSGFELSVYTRTKSKVADLLAEGVRWYDTAAQCAAGQDAVITMVGYPKDVEEVYFGENGILKNADKGTFLIDMTTTDPSLSVRIFEAAAQQDLHALDAPVSGGDTGAIAGTLSVMVGGEQTDYDTCLPIFEAVGGSIRYTGTAGSGQHTKMANQIALGGAMAGVCEALLYGQKNGLDIQNMLDCISKGAAGSWQMSNNAPRVLAGDYAPGFFIKHYIKDLNIALEQAQNAGAELEITQRVRDMYRALEQQGEGDLGTQALILHYDWEKKD